MTALRFAKMSGAGNDFIVLDNRRGQVGDPAPEWIRKICARGLAVGADGLLLLETSRQADFAMRYFNADGSMAAMCGNGGRCLARFALLMRIGREGREMRFTAPSGAYTAVVEASRVRLHLPDVTAPAAEVRLDLAAGPRSADVLDTGVPHAVLFTERLEQEDVERLGREIRGHASFAPAGTNVNFCQAQDAHTLAVRTYERGVEGETLACGTGAAAAALAASRRGLVTSPVSVQTRGGSVLEMEFVPTAGGFSEVWQTGEARLVYWGELQPEALEYTLPEGPAGASAISCKSC